MSCSKEVKQAGLKRVVIYLLEVEARTIRRWRGQVMWHIRALCVAIPARYFGDIRGAKVGAVPQDLRSAYGSRGTRGASSTTKAGFVKWGLGR